MRWHRPKRTTTWGDKRTVRRVAWTPRRIGEHVIWLERYEEDQVLKCGWHTDTMRHLHCPRMDGKGIEGFCTGPFWYTVARRTLARPARLPAARVIEREDSP